MREYENVLYKMVLADDDAIIRRGLLKGIDWEKNGIRVVGAAADGEEAWELIEEHAPQILLTDIKMPFMDGIQLTEKVREKYPDMQILLLSAYEDFQYARAALKNKVRDYLLKPLDSQKLLEAVMASVAAVRQQDIIKSQRRQSIPLLKNQFFQELLMGQITSALCAERMELLEIPMADGAAVVLAVNLADYEDDSKVLQGELLKYAVVNIAKELLEVLAGEVFSDGRDTFYIVLSAARGHELELMSQSERLAHKLINTVLSLFQSAVCVGIGNVCGGLIQIADSYHQANEALEVAKLKGEALIVSCKSPNKPDYKVLTGFEKQESDYIHTIHKGNVEEAKRILASLQMSFMADEVSLRNVHLWAIGLAALLHKEIGSWSNVEINEDYYELCNQIRKCASVKNVFSILEQQTESTCAAVGGIRTQSKYTIVKNAEACMRRNFHKSELSLQTVAEELGVSAVYLSILFKQINKINFSNFLFDLRMEMAGELARTTQLKAYEIGGRVGYVNANYFYLLFKKKYGCTVGEFRAGGITGKREDL